MTKRCATLAYETTDLNDLHRITQSRICVSPSTAFPAAFRIDRCDDAWRYAIWTAEVFNVTRYAIGELQGVLSVGYQGIRNSRDIARVTSRALTNQQVYPNGFNEAQPPGDKVSDALIIENAFTLISEAGWRTQASVMAGAGRDRSALGSSSRRNR